MSIRAFSGTSRTLTGIIIENSNLSNPSLLGKLIATKNKLNNTLEEVIDVDKDLKIYTNHQLNSQILYKTNGLNFNTQLLRINREEEILVTIEP